MKRFLQKLSDIMADAALLEMGVDVQTTADYRFKTVSEPVMSRLKKFFQNVTDTLANAALLEMGVNAAATAVTGAARESLEENLVEVAFAEEADYDDIHKAILSEHRQGRDVARPDDCQYDDNDMCFRHAA